MNSIISSRLLIGVVVFSLKVVVAIAQDAPTFNLDQDPKPDGKKWVIVEELSDEFDGDILDESKWKNTDPNRWLGRAPGIFKKDVVSVSDGNLRLTVYQLAAPEVVNNKTWSHAGGYIGSKNAAQIGYYFEARMKSSKTFMSSTFWLINNRSDGNGCDIRTTELDIQECIGQITTDKSWAQNKYREMGSNTHSRNTVCPETPIGSKGNHTDIGAPTYDDYHIYAAWWKSATEILFFLDGKYLYTVQPEANFNLPMYLRMVSETYDWNPVPADGGMTGSAEDRTTSYDWVRTWKLVDDVANSINETKAKSLKIYPNPAQKEIRVRGLDTGRYQISMINLEGIIVKDFETIITGQFAEFNISELPKGVYFLRFHNEKKNQLVQFVKI